MNTPLLHRVIRTVIASCLIVGPSLVTVSAQIADTAPLELADAPEMPGGWLIVITTTRGLDASGTSALTITSSGVVTCVGQLPLCRGTIEGQELTSLSQLILQPWPSLGGLPRSRCFECSRTQMIVKMRDQAGQQHQRAILWDLSTEVVVPQEIYQLFGEAKALAGQQRSHWTGYGGVYALRPGAGK
jgi:hypothetical protein